MSESEILRLKAELATLRQWQLLATAGYYDMTTDDRWRAAQDLESLFLDLVDALKPALFVEVGAFDARTSLAVKQRNPAMRVVALEANPFNHAEFAARFQHQAAGVDYLHLAASNRNGEARFKILRQDQTEVPRCNPRSSLLARRAGSKAHAYAYEDVTVRTVTLDSLFPEADETPCAAWIDVEGANGPVLKGGRALLARTCVLLIEVEEIRYWEGQWLAPKVLTFLDACDLVPIARDFELRGQYNLLCIRRDLMASLKVRNCMIAYLSRCAFPKPAPEAAP